MSHLSQPAPEVFLGFEGPEKNLQVIFKQNINPHSDNEKGQNNLKNKKYQYAEKIKGEEKDRWSENEKNMNNNTNKTPKSTKHISNPHDSESTKLSNTDDIYNNTLNPSEVDDLKHPRSLRSVTESRWSKTLSLAKCKILSSISNDNCTAFILSESSLFVFDDRIVLKTCGTTPLLLALDDVFEVGRSCGLVPAAVLYWRKNLSEPWKQETVHQNFEREVEYLENRCGRRDNNKVAILGPRDKDHFCVFYSEMIPRDKFKPIFGTFEVKMHEIHPEKASEFNWESGFKRPETINKIYGKLPKYKIDEFFFDPCGFSMNGIKGMDYETIHVTPEGSCSYVSFETTDKKFMKSNEKIEEIVEIFKPFTFISVEITSRREGADDLNSVNYGNNESNIENDGIKCSNYDLIAKDSTTIGDIEIKFHLFETNEMHPMTNVAKRRQQRIPLYKDVQSMKVS